MDHGVPIGSPWFFYGASEVRSWSKTRCQELGIAARNIVRQRKRMGIEPTKHHFGCLTSFEDWGGHQTSKRFRNAAWHAVFSKIAYFSPFTFDKSARDAEDSVLAVGIYFVFSFKERPNDTSLWCRDWRTGSLE